jgi:hypothetical protein
MQTLRITTQAETRQGLARQLRELASALTRELADTERGIVLDSDGITAGSWDVR